jgi:flavorubredoxin
MVLDTVDRSVANIFFENLEFSLRGKALDYIVIHHMEPDHSAVLDDLIRRYPDVKIIANTKIAQMIKQFFDFDIEKRGIIVKEGDTFSTGAHTFTFLMAPMVHWPEVMFSYESKNKVIFSADAFGTFGALNGNLFADEVNFESEWLPDARRYYANIVGKYGRQVQTVLKKMSAFDITAICPLHGPIWRENLDWYLEKYERWSTYTPEENTVLIAYASIYGNTENAVNILSGEIAKRGVHNIAIYDVSQHATDILVSEFFRCGHIVFASATYNAGIFIRMEEVLRDIESHHLKNRTIALIENGSWAATAGSQMRAILEKLDGMNFIDPIVKITSSVKDADRENLIVLAEKIVLSLRES